MTTVLILWVLIGLSCQSVVHNDTGLNETRQPPGTATLADAWYAVYFTDPTHPSSQTLRGGPDQVLADAIRKARLRVDLAVYQLDLWSIRDALLDAHRRGVQVRMVTESNYLDEQEVQQLIETGIPVLGDRREGFMHNKFVVIDRQEVWTGSMNLSVNDAYRNNNNLVRIRSAKLAENYTAEFEEMFLDDHFGPGSPAKTPHPMLTLNGTKIEVYFSPEDHAASRIRALIQSAQESIHFLAFSFTSDELAEAMIERAQAGVEVLGVLEEAQVQSNLGTEWGKFQSAGLHVRLDGNPNSMHHKIILIDRKIVITGSYNFTLNAENKNDENLLIIFNSEIASQFLREFERVYFQSKK